MMKENGKTINVCRTSLWVSLESSSTNKDTVKNSKKEDLSTEHGSSDSGIFSYNCVGPYTEKLLYFNDLKCSTQKASLSFVMKNDPSQVLYIFVMSRHNPCPYEPVNGSTTHSFYQVRFKGLFSSNMNCLFFRAAGVWLKGTWNGETEKTWSLLGRININSWKS